MLAKRDKRANNFSKGVNNIKGVAGIIQAIANTQDQFVKISLNAKNKNDNLTDKPLAVEKDPILQSVCCY